MAGETGAEAQEAKETAPAVTALKQEAAEEWQVIGATVPGASHLRAGIPNQDAILFLRESSVSLPIVLSLSDGHGSDKCFRSDRGSRYAVMIGAELMREALSGDPSKIADEAKAKLTHEFARQWNAAVAADLERQPLSEEELARLETKDSIYARRAVEAHPPLAYGATSLTVALTQSFIIYLQLGDGEILTVSEAGEVAKPLPEDDRLLANETTSLCAKNAAEDFRFSFQPLMDAAPALILLTTDGYANSFSDDAGFQKVGSDILEMLRTDGFDAVNRSVKEWLEEATRMGSGDDCTLGIICRMSALKSQPAPTAIEVEASMPPLTPLQEAPENIADAAIQPQTEQVP